jgi:hypothetical protein
MNAITKIIIENKQKFDLVKSLNLPIGHYAITSSGPLGIRGIRLINDIDLVVDNELWQTLKKKYGEITEDGISKIIIDNGQIEVLGKGSFWSNYHKEDPTIKDQIAQADIIDGLPFVNLQQVIYFKKKLGREKDLRDMELVEKYRDKNT